jgi:hypothetical protein
MVPSWQVPGDPFLRAAVVGAVTVACLWLARWLGSRAIKFERTMLAGFLVAMPLVYVMGWFAARDHAASSWIWVELLGLALFAAFTALGLKNSPWFLAIGIAGHGFAWDLWHYKNSAYIPGLVRSCLHARGLSARCLCGRAYPRVQRGVAHSEGQLRRSAPTIRVHSSRLIGSSSVRS